MYRSVQAAFWTDPKVRKMLPIHKLLFLYLITNPHTDLSGLFYLPRPLAVHETGLTEEEIRYGMDTLSTLGLVEVCVESDLIWVKNMLKFQAHGDKAKRHVKTHIAGLHNSLVLQSFCKSYGYKNPYHTDTLSTHRTPVPSGTGTGTGTEEKTSAAVASVEPVTEKTPAYSDAFLLFWKRFPKRRRSNQAGCWGRWKALGCEQISAAVLEGLDRWRMSADWTKDDGQFIPAPMPWLKDRKWEAHPPPPAPQPDEHGFVRRVPTEAELAGAFKDPNWKDVPDL